MTPVRTERPSLASATASSRRREVVWGALVCLAFALVFAWSPIASLGHAVWSPADISQTRSITSLTPGWRPGNELMSDVWAQMHAWVQFQRDRIHAGHLPLWNPWNGNGAPLLANYQSAVFSPFQAPFYVLPFAWAVVVAGVAKLFCASFFTFLFLRELRLAFTAAIAGGMVFAYAAYHTLLIGYPHSGVSATLPVVLFCVERLVRRTAERESGAEATSWWRARSVRGFVALTVALVAMQFAGHPETLYFAAAFVTVYTVARLSAAWYDARTMPNAARRERRRDLVGLAAQLTACALGAAAVGALQTVPFLEYLQSSAMIDHRSARQTPLGLFSWPTQFFPKLLGNPSNAYYLSPNFPRPDYTIATMVYVGATALLAAVTAFLFVRRRRANAFFAFALLGWFVYAYDLFDSGALWSRIPTLSIAPINRSQFVGAFCVAVLTGFTVHHLLENKARRPWIAAFVLVVGLGSLVLSWDRAADVVALADRYLTDPAKRELLATGSARHLREMSATILVGVALLTVPWIFPSAWVRRGAACALVGLAFVQSGWLHRNYMPKCDERHFYPETSVLHEWRERAEGRTLLVLGDDTLVPCTNVVYRLRQVANYDALGVARHERLFLEHFGRTNNWMLATRATTRALTLFGVGAVASRDDWLDVDTTFAFAAHEDRAVFSLRPLTAGIEVAQTFTGVEDGLDSILLRCQVPGRGADVRLRLVLEDATRGDVLATAVVALDEARADARGVTKAVARFAPIADSGRRLLRARVTAERATTAGSTAESATSWPEDRAPVLLARQDWRDWIEQAVARAERTSVSAARGHPDAAAWKLETNGELEDGQLYLDLGHAAGRWSRESKVGRFTWRDFDGSPGRFHAVTGARVVADGEASFTAVNARDFDPAREVVLEGVSADVARAPAPADVPARSVTIVSEEPEHVRLRVAAGTPGWLVTTQTWYPGWYARVDGVERRIERANHAFGAVELGEGACEVELVYDPISFRFALWLALTSTVLLAAWWVLSKRT